MCGIIGNLRKNNSIDELTLDNLIKSSKEMQCRGPDFFDYFLDKNKKIFIGHLRLSIIDPSPNANQPIKSKNGRYIISFNGEIYNFKELATKIVNLEKSSLLSDTRVLIEYISLFGVKKTLEDIEGMYAIAIYDMQENFLHLTRDFYGKKPIYYYHDSDTIFFASTLKPLIVNKNIKKKINLDSLDHYFHYGFCPNKDSIFENIKKVAPNNLISFNLNNWKVEINQIHEKKIPNKNLNFKLDYDYLDNLLFNSVKKRFVADVPVSVLLSSGIDSSLIASYASQIDKKVETYTVGFEEQNFDESQDSKKIANYFGLRNNTIKFNNNEIKDIIYNIPEAFDEPFADSSQIPTMLIFKKISDYSKVCITGDGGDEIFYGYNRYQWFLIWKKFFKNNYLNNDKTKYIFTKLLNLFEKSFIGKKFFNKFNITTNKTQKFINIFFNDKNIYESFLKLSDSKNFINKKNIFFDKNLEDLEDLRDFDIKNYMVDDILTKVDRSSMFYSVEARSPFLDKDIHDYVQNISLRDNIDIFSKKKILKKILKKKLPTNFISNKKKGFAIPLDKYLYKDFKSEILKDFDEIKTDERLCGLNINNINEIINRFYYYNDYKLSYQVWSFYVFFKWFKKYKNYINN